jgi:hypothetical protein
MFKANPSNTYIPAKSISIKPESQINYGQGTSVSQVNSVKFLIPQYLGFVDPRETYVKYDFNMTGRGQYGPDPRAGVHSCWRGFRLQDGTGSTTIEEVQDYNALVAQWWKYTQNASIRDKRDMYEGRNGSLDSANNLYTNALADWSAGAQTAISAKKTVEIVQPLYSGILGGPKVFPVVATKGLRLTMDLAPLNQSIVPRDGNLGFENSASADLSDGWLGVKTLKAPAVTIVDGGTGYANGAGEATTSSGAGVGQLVTITQAAGVVDSIVVTTVGTGYLVGDTQTIASGNADCTYTLVYSDAKLAIGTEFSVVVQQPADGPDGRGVNRDASPRNNNPFDIGDRLYTSAAADGTGELSLGIISGFTKDGANDLEVTYVPERAVAAFLPNPIAVGDRLFIKRNDRTNPMVYTAFTDAGNQLNSQPLGYTMANIEMICSVVSPPAEYVSRLVSQVGSGEGLNMDFKTFSTYRNNLSILNGLTSQLISATEERAYSILSVPLCSANQNEQNTSSFKGLATGSQDYQYIFGGSQIPNRPISLLRYSNTVPKTEALHLIETEKALSNCGYAVRDLQRVPQHFFIGRALSKYGQVFNLKERDLSLRVDYSGVPAVSATLDHTKQFSHFVCHLRRLVIGANGVQVFW